MSQYFKVAGRSVWNPATTAAQLFYRTAEAMTVVAGRPSGILDLEFDEYDIGLPAYRAFVEELTRRYLTSTHPVIVELVGGFLPHAVALLRAAGGDLPLLDQVAAGQSLPRGVSAAEKARRVLASAADLAPSMAA
ncbi:DUF6086 family protein [Actinoplanes sp. CA-252034]|uniref:DUF6086 family protein n=1 Tax=Actinoplanes sp. CA-252034 TaxID=3239906 RepID=UPI003D97895B